jgi:hypothetical protein
LIKTKVGVMGTINNHFKLFCKIFTILLLYFCMIFPASGQRVKTYKVWVTLMDRTKIKGTLYAVNEDALELLREDLKIIKLDPKNIEVIKFRRSGSVGRGAWIGAASGFVAGALVGLATNDRDEFLGDPQYSMLGGGIVGLPIGLALGTGIGSAKKKIIVNGNEDAYRSHLSLLREFTPQTSARDSIERGLEYPK